MPVDLDSEAFEEDFFRAAVKSFEVMIEEGPKEPYYGFALYADGYYTDCGFYFATNSSYRDCLSRADPEYIRTKQARWQYRWNCGDWAYSSFAAAPQALRDIARDMLGKWAKNASDQFDLEELTEDDWFEYGARVFESACRVAVRLESDATFQQLHKTEDYHTVVSDHDETEVASYLRLDIFKSRGVVLLPGQRIDHGVDYDDELDRLLDAWDEEK